MHTFLCTFVLSLVYAIAALILPAAAKRVGNSRRVHDEPLQPAVVKAEPILATAAASSVVQSGLTDSCKHAPSYDYDTGRVLLYLQYSTTTLAHTCMLMHITLATVLCYRL
jgi:hypothetical protein